MKTKGRTGERVTMPGNYENKYGKRISLSTGDSFPPCPKEGKPIDWQKTD